MHRRADLLQWERHVLPTLEENCVHVIVTHGKTLKKYTQQMQWGPNIHSSSQKR